ncbi:MAG: DUF2336 domain-containing protein, partial [Alphaproteobacteria bacterium]
TLLWDTASELQNEQQAQAQPRPDELPPAEDRQPAAAGPGSGPPPDDSDALDHLDDEEALLASIRQVFGSASESECKPAASATEAHDTPERARYFAQRMDAPHALIQRLASCGIEIAEPVLRSSPVLSQADLTRIVKMQSAAHAQVVAGRWDIGPDLAEAILAYRNDEVRRTLLANAQASISDATLERLGKQACSSTALRDALLERRELPVGLITELLESIWGEPRVTLLEKLIPAMQSGHAYRLEIPKKTLRSRRFVDGMQLAERLVQRGVNEAILVDLARKKKQLELLLCFSKLFALEPDTVLTVMTEKSGLSLATLCRAKGLSVDTFSQVITAADSGRQKDPNEVLALLQFYKRLPAGDAVEAVKLWRARLKLDESDSASEESAREALSA